MPNNTISVPMWYVSGNPPQALRDDMSATVEFLVQVTEVLFILLVITTVSKSIPYVVVQVEDAKVDPKMPIKYRLSVDIAKMTGMSP